MKTRELVLVALFVAVIAALAQVSLPIPFSPVPITGQVFGVLLAGALLGSRLGGLAVLVYLLLGAAGLPVFARGTGGAGMLVGPTGGYLFGFAVAAYLVGRASESISGQRHGRAAGGSSLPQSNPAAEKALGPGYGRLVVGMFCGLTAIYALGALQLALVAGLPWQKVLLAGVLPFLPLDLVKALGAAALAAAVRRRRLG